MGFFKLHHKTDKTLQPYLKMNTKKKLPVIISCKNPKLVKSKLLSLNGRIKYEYTQIPGFACELSPGSIDKLSFIPEINSICYDHNASLCMRKTGDATGSGMAKVLGLSGSGIGVALIDSGAYPHPDLTSNRHAVRYFKDLINLRHSPYDDNGHGTFLCGCIAGSGMMSDGLYSGIAPGADLYVIKAFNEAGTGRMSDIIAGLEDILLIKEQKPIHILCLPFEFPTCSQLGDTLLELAITKVYEAGIIVVAPSGNTGPMAYTIHFPGNLPHVLTVGGTISSSSGLRGFQIASFSGRGPTYGGLVKPDLTAPCAQVTSLMSDVLYKPGSKAANPLPIPYTVRSGTSIACAVICGYAAIMLEKNPCLSAADIKSLLCLSTLSLGDNKYSQGSGMFFYSRQADGDASLKKK